MKAVRMIAGLLGIFIVTPIWYYLVYQILGRVNASDVMWLLYWVYLPVGVFVQILLKIAKAE